MSSTVAPRGSAKQQNAEYEKACLSWWRTGPFHTRLAKHRDYLLKDRVPREEKIDAASAEQWALMGVPTPTFHSTAPMKAASEYARRAQQIFRERMVQPFTAR